MASDPIPDEVRQFILNNIDSVAELEGLLLLRRSPETAWSAGELARELYVSVPQSEVVLERLHSHKLLRIDSSGPSTYRYGPESGDLAETVERTANTYSSFIVPVTNLIHSKLQAKVQQFADAFKLKKEEE